MPFVLGSTSTPIVVGVDAKDCLVAAEEGSRASPSTDKLDDVKYVVVCGSTVRAVVTTGLGADDCIRPDLLRNVH